MEKGRLIVSTKKAQTGRLRLVAVTGIIGSLMTIGIAIFCFTCPETFRPLSRDSYRLISIILGMVFLCMPFYPLYNFTVIWYAQKSYIAVYERCIEGYTVVSKTVPQQQFLIPFQDILNISVATNRISIHTQYATFEVLAMTNCETATEEIRKRLAIKENIK